jgi:hypothetical protein
VSPEPARVRLVPGRWVRLPGTGWEVYLHGKPGEEGVEVACTHQRAEYGGWDLRPVEARCYVRRARVIGPRP